MTLVLADNGSLDLGGGLSLKIPLWYDDLAKTGMVPRYEDVAVLPPELLKQPVSLQQAAALAESARIRGLLRGRWMAAGKNFLAAVPPHGAAAQQQHDSAADAAAAADADAAGTSPPPAAAAAAAAFERQLHPAAELDTPATVHWSILQYRQQLQQQQEAAAAAEAARASKKRPASAAAGGGSGSGGGFGGLCGKEAKKLAAELAAGSGGQWWYVPGVGDGEQQAAAKRRRGAHLPPEAQAAWEDAALAKAWQVLVRRDVPRAAKLAAARRAGVAAEAERLAESCSRELRLRAAKAAREAGRGAGASLRRLLRDGQAWWRAAGREVVGASRAAARAAAEAARKAEEEREARRQQQRLNFLLTQTELYSHFMKNKLGTGDAAAAAAAGGTPGSTPVKQPPGFGGAAGSSPGPAGFSPLGVNPAGGFGSSPAPRGGGDAGGAGFSLQGLGVRIKQADLADDEAEAARLAAAAAAKAQAAAASAMGAAAAFDQEYAVGAAAVGAAPSQILQDQQQQMGMGLPPDQQQQQQQVDLTQPTTMPEASGVVQPSGFRGSLKGYQLKGVQWLSSLYDQGLNGILADEMGLGKTVQALAFLAHLAEARGVWGPFLVVAPASTLHNWDKELSSFTPGFKVLPYWGNLADRKTLRRLLAPSRLYGRAAPFHVALTSYQIAVADEAVLRKVKWQFMILDEAQAIKSSGSARWRALLTFGCRNRLLLSGTPIQNNLQELWALLHFIMPQLFDSRDAFNEWFSRGSNNAAAGAGGTGSGAPQMSLDKQQLARLHGVLGPFMLRRVKKDVVAEMVPKTEITLRCSLSRRQAQLYAALRRNLTLQDLLAMGARSAAGAAGRPGKPAVSAAASSRLMGLIMQMRKVCNHPELMEGQAERWPFTFAASTTANNPADNAPPVPAGPGRPPKQTVVPWVQVTGFRSHLAVVLPSVWGALIPPVLSPPVALVCSAAGLVAQQAALTAAPWSRALLLGINSRPMQPTLPAGAPPLLSIAASWRVSALAAAALQPPRRLRDLLPNTDAADAAGGDSSAAEDAGGAESGADDSDDPPRQPLAGPLLQVLGSAPPGQPYALAKALCDSGKLTALDSLLMTLKAEGHRVLVFCQMTTMMDLLEELFAYRRHRWLRLDGSTPIAERRDLVDAWQGGDSHFVFLLSTRAGGLGINLTAADTVIFYESDWNPTMDLQAMDRCHRLGQTRPVTVYRLVTAGTIEERIQSTAAAKTHVQRLVMAGDKGAAAAAAGEAGPAAEAGGGAAAEQEEEVEEDEHMLIQGNAPDDMLYDELDDEEGGPGASAAGSGGAMFVDDAPAALGAADVASLLFDDDLADEAAKQGLDSLSLSELNPDDGITNPSPGAAQQQQGLGFTAGRIPGFSSGLTTPSAGPQQPSPQGLGFGFQPGGSAPPPAAGGLGFAGGSTPGTASPAASGLPGASGAAAAASAGVGVAALSFKRRGVGRPPGPGRGAAAAAPGTGRGRGRRGRPPGSGKAGQIHGVAGEGGRGRGRGRRGRGRKKQGEAGGGGDWGDMGGGGVGEYGW
ncbi:hypothetical protein OEZ85_007772 [Tetradesmus obliquus]|uniref:Chromatin-remodeling ATPase INO80 n=1 Tax=Tetradesmus obliquus TaxID=3088 RepID=A0ABY8TJ49_TETOB|nr:hypothetical protein OEZ85_007772 [Tetradesmus obliquus]